jgi:thiamine biosynthesis lipoprotein
MSPNPIHKNWKYPLILFVLLALIPSCSKSKPSIYKKGKVLMDSFVTISVVSDSAEKAEEAIEKAFSAIGHFGDLIDFFSDKSELSEINRNAGIKGVHVSPATLELIEFAVYVSGKSGGAFDPTIGPVIQLWDFHNKIKPSADEIRKKLPLVDYRKIIVDRNRSTVFLKEKGMMLDLGGIAKGYAADLAVKVLKENGIASGIVAAAGDIRTFGLKPDGTPWNIGIRNPRQTNESDELIAKLRLSDKAVSTSGDYERFFLLDGKRYHHILVDTCRSVSIITDEGVLADAFDNAVFVMGPEKGLKFLREAGMDGVIIDSSGKVHQTPALEGILSLEAHN